MSFAELRAGVLALPEEQRMEIVDLLLESLPEETPEGILTIDDPGFYDELDAVQLIPRVNIGKAGTRFKASRCSAIPRSVSLPGIPRALECASVVSQPVRGQRRSLPQSG